MSCRTWIRAWAECKRKGLKNGKIYDIIDIEKSEFEELVGNQLEFLIFIVYDDVINTTMKGWFIMKNNNLGVWRTHGK